MDIKRKVASHKEKRGEAEGDAALKERGRFIGGAVRFLLLGALGYLGGTGVLPFGAAPFGGALLCSGRASTLGILVGLCLWAAQSPSPILYIGIWIATLCVRILGRVCLENNSFREVGRNTRESATKLWAVYGMVNHLFGESLPLRMAVASLCSFGIALVRALGGGLLYYDVIGMVISVAATPPLTYFFSKGISSGAAVVRRDGTEREKREAMLKCVGVVALCLMAVFTLRGKSVYGIALSPLVAMGATLFFCRVRGMLFGGVAGLALGLAYSPILAPIFVFTAFTAGALFPFSVSLGAWSGFAIGVAWGFYVRGIGALSGLFGALFASALLFGVADRLFIAPRLSAKAAKQTRSARVSEGEAPSVAVLPEWALDTARLDASKQKIKNICETLSSLSESLGGGGAFRAKGIGEGYYDICENAFDSACGGCPTRELCRRRVSVAEEARRLSRAYMKNRCVGIGDGGKELFSVCQRLPDIIDEINHNAAFLGRGEADLDRSEIFSLDYGALADLIAEAQVEEGEEFVPDTELSEALCREIGSMELSEYPEGVAVWGRRRRRVTVRGNFNCLRAYKSELLDVMEGVLPFGVDRESAEVVEGRVCELRVSEAPRLSVARAVRSEAAEGESEFCGDSVGAFYDSDGRFYACISDGMGSGRRAAQTSEMCVDFVEKMLSGGAAVSCRSARKVLDMLNLLLRNRNMGSAAECSATLDLLEIDLINGKAFFCKCGAAPTYIFRSGSLFKIRSETLPLGILGEVDCKAISFEVDSGDLIVMLSDGAVMGKEESPWLFELLSCAGDRDRPEAVADRIIRRAKSQGSPDDISVAVIKIK